MRSLFIIAHLKTTGEEARKKVIDMLVKIADYSAAKEPGVTQFCIALPREDDGTSVYAIEEYASQYAFNKHLTSPASAEMVALFTGKLQLFSSKPDIYGMTNKLTPSAYFKRPSLKDADDPTIMFSTFEYKPGMTKQAVKGWKGLVKSTEETEPGTLTYAVFEQGKIILTVEAYESIVYFENVHVKSAAVEEQLRQNGDIRVGAGQIHFLKKIGGYLA